MDFSYTPEQQRLIARVRELCDFIQPYELECEMNNGLTPRRTPPSGRPCSTPICRR